MSALGSTLLSARFRRLTTELPDPDRSMPVALIYVCCDDFRHECIVTLLAQDHGDCHVFVFDDSKDAASRAEADEWCRVHAGQATYFHRPTARGFKAGNLNDGMKTVPARYEALFVCDADERIGRSMVRELTRWLTADTSLAYVQALHISAPPQTEFAAALGDVIGCVWKMLMPWRVWFGLPPILGHGVLIRRIALDGVGGFPEVSSEDIHLTGNLRVQGWKGTCAWTTESAEEDVPKSFVGYSRRLFRWTAQDTETTIFRTVPILRNRELPLAERLDWVTRNARFPICGLALPYLLAIALWSTTCPERHEQAMGVGGFLIGLAASFASGIVFLLYHWRQPVRALGMGASTATVALLSLPTWWHALLAGLRRRETEFVPTGSNHAETARSPVHPIAAIAYGAILTLGGIIGTQPLLMIVGAVISLTFAQPKPLPFHVLRWIVLAALAGGIALHASGVGSPVVALLICAIFSLVLI